VIKYLIPFLMFGLFSCASQPRKYYYDVIVMEQGMQMFKHDYKDNSRITNTYCFLKNEMAYGLNHYFCEEWDVDK